MSIQSARIPCSKFSRIESEMTWKIRTSASKFWSIATHELLVIYYHLHKISFRKRKIYHVIGIFKSLKERERKLGGITFGLKAKKRVLTAISILSFFFLPLVFGSLRTENTLPHSNDAKGNDLPTIFFKNIFIILKCFMKMCCLYIIIEIFLSMILTCLRCRL